MQQVTFGNSPEDSTKKTVVKKKISMEVTLRKIRSMDPNEFNITNQAHSKLQKKQSS